MFIKVCYIIETFEQFSISSIVNDTDTDFNEI